MRKLIKDARFPYKNTANADKDSREERLFNRKLQIGQTLIIIVSVLGFSIYTILAIITAHQNNGTPFGKNRELLAECVSYGFLSMFFIMLFVNLALFVQIRKKNKLFGKRTYQFKKEQCTMVIILLFFELSYGIRYVNDQFFSQQRLEKRGQFAYFLSY